MRITMMKERNENPSKESLCLKEGEVYTFIVPAHIEEHEKRKRTKKRVRLIKRYRHHAVFEDRTGIRQSYRYWDIEKLLLGEPR